MGWLVFGIERAAEVFHTWNAMLPGLPDEITSLARIMRIPDIPLIDVFGRGGALKSSWYGDCLPERDFPTLISLYLQGRLPLEKFVSERIGLDDIEDAFHKMHAGEVLRSVVVFK